MDNASYILWKEHWLKYVYKGPKDETEHHWEEYLNSLSHYELLENLEMWRQE